MAGSILAAVHIIGGMNNSSSFFTFGSGVDGGVLRRIGLWAGGSGFGGLRVWLSSIDSPQTFGTTQGSYREFTFQDGERMLRLSLWGNGAGTRSGGIEFHTSTGRSFKHNMTSWGLQQEFPINVASGICVGVRGWHGTDTIGLHALGLVFLNDISFAQMTNLRYPTLAFDTVGIQPISIRNIRDDNQSYITEKSWSNAGSYSATSSSSWSVTTGLQYHMIASVSGGIPGIAQVQGEVGWQLSVSGTYENGYEETETWSWDRAGVIPPRHWHTFTITTRRGRISLPYEASMHVTLRNGARFTYNLRGLYAGVTYTNLNIVTANGDLDVRGAAVATDQLQSVAEDTTRSDNNMPPASGILIKESEKANDSIQTRVVRSDTDSFTDDNQLSDADQPRAQVIEGADLLIWGGTILEGEIGGTIVFIEADAGGKQEPQTIEPATDG